LLDKEKKVARRGRVNSTTGKQRGTKLSLSDDNQDLSPTSTKRTRKKSESMQSSSSGSNVSTASNSTLLG